jgi:hypothetical protein
MTRTFLAVCAIAAATTALMIPTAALARVSDGDTSRETALSQVRSDAGDAQGSRLLSADAVAAPDWIERYAAAHPYGKDTVNASPSSSVSPSLAQIGSDAGDASASRLLPVAATRSASARVGLPAAAVSADSFNWGDAGIGAMLGAIAIALLGACVFALLTHYRRSSAAI